MKIIVDAMGGDHAPKAPVEGALQAVKEYGVGVTLVGRGEVILSCLEQMGIRNLPAGLEIANAEQIIKIEDNPATAFKDKKDSSITIGLKLLKEGLGDAFVSAGSTGALLSAATLLVKRVRGIRRAALAPVVPTTGGGLLLIDCGATAECTPEYLLQYAFMGSYYAKRVLNRPKPRVGLLNIGAEPEKGLQLQKETYCLLQEADKEGRISFVGNVEAREAILGGADVLVADGYSGNVFLKTYEGAAMFMGGKLKDMLKKDLRGKIAALLLLGELRKFKKSLDSGEIGGTALLGISKPVIKAHGSSDAYAVKNAIRQAIQLANSDLIEDITKNVSHMRLPVRNQDGEKTAEEQSAIMENSY